MSSLKCISPIDGSVFAERNAFDITTARTIVEQSKAAQKPWQATSLDDRIALIKKGLSALEAMNDEIVPELAHMMGRPVRYGGEFGGVKERSYAMLNMAADALKPVVVEESDNFSRYITREAVGVVLVIAPWNYPYLTAVNTIVPALAAGNAVVLKHSTQTLLVGERMVEAFKSAGVPEGVFSNVYLDHATTGQLIKDRSFGFINFTGSVDGGKAIETGAAGTFTNIGLELGGKDPGYVMADANLDVAVETLIDGAMFNSGQCCCSIERIYVDESLYDAFVEKATAIVTGYTLGNPLDPETTLGPMAHERFAKEVKAQLAEALADGAKGTVDPSLFPDLGPAYVAPQILVDVDHTIRVMRDETFGPLVGIMKVKSEVEAIELMNDSNFGLTASIWTSNLENAARIGAQLETGTVFMNRCDYVDPGLCWTGCKDTGRGAALSSLGYQSVTRPKSYHLKKVV
ncbi:MAG: aldehyde dehydrogenase family protein [Cocleimonas sp.]